MLLIIYYLFKLISSTYNKTKTIYINHKCNYYIYFVLLLILYTITPSLCYSTVTPDTVQSRHQQQLVADNNIANDIKTNTEYSLVARKLYSTATNTQQSSLLPNGLILVSTLEGTLHCINLSDGNYLWQYNTNKTLLSSTQQQLGVNTTNNNNNNNNNNDTPFIVPGIDGTLYFIGELGIQKLPITIDELVTASPFRAKDNTRFIGNKYTSALLIDKLTGKIYNNYTPTNNSHSNLYGLNYDECVPTDNSDNNSQLLWLGKSDLYVRALDGRSGVERWNVSITSYSSMYDKDERELTSEECEQLNMPKFAVSVDGTLLALNVITQSSLWQHTFNSTVTNIHFVPHINNDTVVDNDDDNNNINNGVYELINNPSDIMRVPYYYFDSNDPIESQHIDYVTAAINHYYRRLHNAVNDELLYVGKTNNGFYYALPTIPSKQYSLTTTTTSTTQVPSVITPPNWQGQKNNNQQQQQQQINNNDNIVAVTYSDQVQCSTTSDNYPDCLTGFHIMKTLSQFNNIQTLAISNTDNDNSIYQSFLPAILPPNYTEQQQLQGNLITDNNHNNQYTPLLPSPTQVSIWSTYIPVIVTSVVVSLSVTLSLLTAVYVYRKNFVHTVSNKRKKRKIDQPIIDSDDEITSIANDVDNTAAAQLAAQQNSVCNNNDIINDKYDVDETKENDVEPISNNTLQLPTIINNRSISGSDLSNPPSNNSTSSSSNGIVLPVRQPSGVAGQYILNKMIIDTTSVLGTGSSGTVVYSGQFEGRICAIKRLVKPFYMGDSIADKEISLLIQTDTHPNMLRYYAKEEDNDFVYIALEKCECTLIQYIDRISSSSDNNNNIHNNNTYNVNDYVNKQQILYDIMNGLLHLHSMNIVHRDLKPANILLNKHNRAKIADMGLGKKLDLQRSSFDSLVSGTVGWQAPEVLKINDKNNDNTTKRLTKAVDIFSAGCIIYYVLTNGQHPYGDTCVREYHILQNKLDLSLLHIQEAVDLISQMCCYNPIQRIIADDIISHPFFWSNEIKLTYLLDVSDRIEVETNQHTLLRLSLEYKSYIIFGNDWSTMINQQLISDVNKFRKYDYTSIRDLLRIIRNKKNHYNELTIELQNELGIIPHNYYNYFNQRFPQLLMYVYSVMSRFIVDNTTLLFIISNNKPIITQVIDNIESIDLSKYNFTLNTLICNIHEIQLNSVFKQYYGNITLRRLLQLQQLHKLNYRSWYMSESTFVLGKYVPQFG